jgi:hypothetical protein
MKLDDALEEIVTKLSNKYAPGLCDRHPDLPCFHHRAANLHFNLDRPRLLVWAQAIKSGSATYEKVPMLSPMFKSSLALKHASKNAKDSDTASASNTLPVAQPSTPAQLQMPMPFGNFPPFSQPLFPHMYAQTPMSPFMGYGPNVPYAGNHFFDTGSGTGMVSMPTKASRSPPSSPPTADCTIAEFCDAYDLGEQAALGLEKLGFRFGDNLSALKPKEVAEAGFKVLEWQRVLKAYQKLNRNYRSNSSLSFE